MSILEEQISALEKKLDDANAELLELTKRKHLLEQKAKQQREHDARIELQNFALDVLDYLGKTEFQVGENRVNALSYVASGMVQKQCVDTSIRNSDIKNKLVPGITISDASFGDK